MGDAQAAAAMEADSEGAAAEEKEMAIPADEKDKAKTAAAERGAVATETPGRDIEQSHRKGLVRQRRCRNTSDADPTRHPQNNRCILRRRTSPQHATLFQSKIQEQVRVRSWRRGTLPSCVSLPYRAHLRTRPLSHRKLDTQGRGR